MTFETMSISVHSSGKLCVRVGRDWMWRAVCAPHPIRRPMVNFIQNQLRKGENIGLMEVRGMRAFLFPGLHQFYSIQNSAPLSRAGSRS